MSEQAPSEQPAVAEWSCARCEVTVSWMAEVERPELPATWSNEDGRLHCLVCRREIAGEQGLENAPEDATAGERQKLQSQARIEFEIRRRPERNDNRIASSCHTSVLAVRKARARLGMQSRTSG